jgi:hypothetical protein
MVVFHLIFEAHCHSYLLTLSSGVNELLRNERMASRRGIANAVLQLTVTFLAIHYAMPAAARCDVTA